MIEEVVLDENGEPIIAEETPVVEAPVVEEDGPMTERDILNMLNGEGSEQ